MSNFLTRQITATDVPLWIRTLGPLLPAMVVMLSLMGLQAGQTPDSISYLRAAENLRQTGSFGGDYLLWPPLYPALLALRGPIAPQTFAALLGDFGALATLLGVWLIGRRKLTSPIALALVLLALVAGDRFGLVFMMVWSESLFVPLMVWTTYFWAKHMDGDPGLWPACTLLAFALLTRHVGVVLVIAMALTALRLPKRAVPLCGIALACIPYALWLWRTYALCGAAMGPRLPLAQPSLQRQLDLFGQVWTHWLMPHVYGGGLVIGQAVLVTLVVVLVAVRRSLFFSFAALVLLGHSVLTVYSASRLVLDVDARTLFPVFWLALLQAAYFADRAATGRRWVQIALGLYMLIWFSAPNAIINRLV